MPALAALASRCSPQGGRRCPRRTSDTGRWIAQNTSASATLATIDIGHLGYWSGRPIIDIVGLAQPDVAPTLPQGDFGYAIRHYQPEMVLIGYTWLPEIQDNALVSGKLRAAPLLSVYDLRRAAGAFQPAAGGQSAA